MKQHERDRGFERMVTYQLTDPKERAEIDTVFGVLLAAAGGAGLDSGDGVRVTRVFCAAIKLAVVSLTMMGITKASARRSVSATMALQVVDPPALQ